MLKIRTFMKSIALKEIRLDVKKFVSMNLEVKKVFYSIHY